MIPRQDRLPTGVPVTVREPIRIAVDFDREKIRPLAFLWGSKKYVVQRVNLVYKRPHGDRWLWCFAVSDEANSYVLLYDPESMQWTLEEVYAL